MPFNPYSPQEEPGLEKQATTVQGALLKYMSDQRNSPWDDSIQPSMDAMDVLPPERALALAGKGLMAAKGAASFSPFIAAGLKPSVPWNRYREIMGGVNPIDLSAKDVGKSLSMLGPSVRDKATEAIGAQAIDELGTTTPSQLIQRRLIQNEIPSGSLPGVAHDPNLNAHGMYSPPLNKIYLNEDLASGLQHPEEFNAGVAQHEALHAEQNLKNPKTPYTPEFLPQRPFTTENLKFSGLADTPRIEAYLRYAKENPGLAPGYVQELLAKGYSPKAMAHFLQGNEKFMSEMAENYRIAVGNKGFRGADPLLASTIDQANHFAGNTPGGLTSEILLAPQRLAEIQAKLGGDFHPDWLTPKVQKAVDQYQSPIRPGRNWSPWVK